MTQPGQQASEDRTEIPDSGELQIELAKLQGRVTELFRAGDPVDLHSLVEHLSPLQRSAVLLPLIVHHLELRLQAGENPEVGDYDGGLGSQDLPLVRQAFVQLQLLLAADAVTSAGGSDSSRRDSRSGGSAKPPQNLSVQPVDASVPAMIGNVRIEGLLGRGGFGQVLLGFETNLEIYVAVKVPLAGKGDVDVICRGLLREASRAAQLTSGLTHCGVVRVLYSVQQAGLTAIVMDLVDGQDVDRLLKSRGGRLPPGEAVGLLKQLCLALQHTHENGCIHRDLKPHNLLLDGKGVLWLTDFGLAQQEIERRVNESGGGTIPYMSPEQLQCEILDGRTDLWSLGVIMYQMLCGQRPFQGPEIEKLIRAERYVPLLQRQRDIPATLARICHKCLRKSQGSRYSSAVEILRDLEAWESGAVGESGAAAVVGSGAAEVAVAVAVAPGDGLPMESVQVLPRPRGLQSYGAEDEHFFLRLLPGDVEPDGLPESLHYWRAGRGLRTGVASAGSAGLRLKPDFRVGVIHGRSGCGKSSFLKAGLLPRLSAEVTSIYLTATADGTEPLLLQKLREQYPQLSVDADLPGVFRQLREEILLPTGGRLLIVLDQFEQWLDQHAAESQAVLTLALRQTHASCLQVLVVVREEFWSPTQEFLGHLDQSLDTRQNDQILHLFSESHARQVLIWFGQWYQRLPQRVQDFSVSQEQFVGAAVAGLSSDGRIVPVRLAVFCEMFRGYEWTLSEFDRHGGTEAIERRFLQDQFSSADAPQRQRQHLRAAMLVLESLLPASGGEIRGHQRSRSELCRASGYVRTPRRFAELLEILETDLKLVTRVEQPASDGVGAPAETHYMLTHDFLVHSIRPWVAEELQRTAAGRAEAVLRARDQLYRVRGESQQLPTLREWWQIRRLTDAESWTESQQRMMQAAGRLHLVRGAIAALVISAVLLLTVWLRIQGDQQRAAALALAIPSQKTSELAAGLVPLQLLREYALPTLQKLYREPGNPPEALLHLAIARLQLGDADPELLPTARDRALECRPEQLLPLTKLLQPWAATLQPELRQIAQDEQQAANARLHAACLLAAWEPADRPDTAWSQPATAEFVAAQVAAQNPVFVGAYQDVLRPQAGRLTAPLATLFADPAQTEVARTIVTGLLADYAKDNVPVLAQALLTADPAADKLLFPLLEADRAKAISEFQDVLDLELAIDWADPPLNPAWLEPSEALRSQLEGAKGVLHDRFALCLDLRLSQLLLLCENLRPSGYRPIRMRPFAGDISDDPRMVAVWTRDGNHFQVQTAVPAVELPRTGDNAIREGVLLSELVMIPGTGPKSGWLMVWGDPPLEGEERRCMAGVTLQELAEGRDSLARSNFTVRKSIYVFNDASGERRYTGIFASAGFPGISIEGPLTSAVIDQRPHVDISLAEPWIDVRANLPLRLVTAKDKLDAMPENHASLLEYAKLCWFAGDDIVAIKSLNLLWEQGVRTEELLRFRVFVLARLNRVEEANLCLEEYKRSAATERARFFVEVISAAFLGAETEALTLVEQRLQQTSTDEHLAIAGACAVASGGCARYPEGLRRLREKSLSIIEQTLAVQPYRVAEIIDYDFEALQNESRYREFLADRGFVVLLAENPETNTRLLSAPSLQVMQDQVLLATQSGWRPSAVCVGSEGREVHLIVRQPLIEDARKEALAIRQGAAAVALLRLGAAATVWPLLESRPDPRLRSEILHRLSLYGVDGRALMTQLTAESGSADPAIVSRRRSLIQGLGELAAAKLLPPPLVAEATADLLVRFTQDPDSGVHGMCEWTLRQLGAAEQMLQAEQQFRTGDAVDGRRWYLTKTGGNNPADRGLSFAIINATEPFVMGSPLSEAERFGGPAGQDERRHRRQIGRVVAIGMHEVTVSQFLKFRIQHDFTASYSPTADSPMNTVTWYDAAAFCNWLSEQEGLDSSQWCYEPGEQDYAAGMRIKPNFAELQGYRLPTEAEWERVCRADTVTSRYFGETDRLLGTYAWYTKNSGHKSMQPVSTLRPNGAGAFGLYGNAAEWCMDVVQLYSSDVSVSADPGQGGQVSEDSSRVLRGGSFFYSATSMRSANRINFRPGNRLNDFGFRVSRTYDLRP